MSKEQSPGLSKEALFALKIAATRRKIREEQRQRTYLRMNVEDVRITMKINGELVL